MTPEGKVKAAVKKVLDVYKDRIYYNMPVPTGYGKSMLDFVGTLNGRFFTIETKKPGDKPTTRQEGTIEDMTAGGAVVFVIDRVDGCHALEDWLHTVDCLPPVAGAVIRTTP